MKSHMYVYMKKSINLKNYHYNFVRYLNRLSFVTLTIYLNALKIKVHHFHYIDNTTDIKPNPKFFIHKNLF